MFLIWFKIIRVLLAQTKNESFVYFKNPVLRTLFIGQPKFYNELFVK